MIFGLTGHYFDANIFNFTTQTAAWLPGTPPEVAPREYGCRCPLRPAVHLHEAPGHTHASCRAQEDTL